MKTFTPCKGKTACLDNGERCLACNRSSAEIIETRQVIDALAEIALRHGYENVEAFTAYVAGKAEKKVRHRREG